MGLSKVGRLSLILSHYDAEIEKHKLAIVHLQRERLKASIEAKRDIEALGEIRRKAALDVRARA
jgi:hypothetical protein